MSPRRVWFVVAPLRRASAFRWLICAALSCILGCGTAVPQEPTADRPQPGDSSSSDGGDAAVPECVSNSDCDDGLFCNGQERCLRGVCEPGDRPCGDQACDEGGGVCVAPPSVVVPVLVIPVSNMGALRQACPLATEGDIMDVAIEIDNEWQVGYTLSDSHDGNTQVCGADQDCLFCFDAIAEFVHLEYHSGETPPLSVPPIPLPTLQIAAIYGFGFDSVLELSDGTVSEVTFGSTSGWSPGDGVGVEFGRITNESLGEEVSVTPLGRVVGRSTVVAISANGSQVELLDGSIWQIGILDQIHTVLWLPTQSVLVVQSGAFSFNLVRTSNGSSVAASPL